MEPFPTTKKKLWLFLFHEMTIWMFRGEYVIYREEEVSSPGLKIKKSSKKILKA
jgi:hypothetical protein